MFRVFKESLGILSLASTLLYTSVHMITQASRWFNLQHFSESKMRHISLYFTQHFLIHFVSITRWQLSYFPWFCSGKNSCRIPAHYWRFPHGTKHFYFWISPWIFPVLL